MKEQIYKITEIQSFEPKHIFECGQCFRWEKQEDGSYTGIFASNVLNVKKQGNDVIFQGICKNDIKETCIQYFDLKRDYETIKKQLSQVDEYIKDSINYGEGIRILNQDLWETIISFIISANNNIPRIKGIINRISEKYGTPIIWNQKTYYTFPTPDQLAKASIEELRDLGLGFRDKRVYETTQKIVKKEINLLQLEKEETQKVRQELLTLPGVGPKVADCILLFSDLKRFDVFPIDVWVRRVMNELYIKKEDETKVKKEEIEELAKAKYGNLEGIAQQYLFYWKREQHIA